MPALPHGSSNKAKKGAAPFALKSKWIWNRADSNLAAGGVDVEFRAMFSWDKRPQTGSVVITCDNEYTLFVNGTKVRNDKDWNTAELISITRLLKSGKNTIRIVGKNHTNTPNPAGLYVSVFIDRKPINIQWSTSSGDRQSPAISVTHQQIWAAATSSIASKEQEAMSYQVMAKSGYRPRLRMSHFVSNSLMRSLGRPNREQIVTTRDDQLSTLQALDLSNGQLFADILANGSTRLLRQLGTKEKVVEHVYNVALSRKPTPNESKILFEIVGDKPDAQSIADLLWSVVMLPEFQNVR